MKWVSVKNKLPEISEENTYLTTDGKNYCIKKYRSKDDGFEHNTCECWCTVKIVTYYILLSEPLVDK